MSIAGWLQGLGLGFGAMVGGTAYQTYKYRDQLPNAVTGSAEGKNYSGEILKFPLDVENANGHYVIFNIYERGAPNFTVDNPDLNVYYGSQFTSEKTFDASTDLSKVPLLPDSLKDAKFLQGNPKRLIKDAIVLYMPENVGVKYSTEYEAQGVGLVGKMAAGLGDLMKGNTTGGEAAVSNIMQLAQSIEPLVQLGTLGGAEGLSAAVQAKTGLAAGDVTEMTFKGLNYREFSFTFSLTPNSQKEALMIKQICDTFTYHMLPEKIGRGAALAYRVPGQFTMRYMYRGKTNRYLHQQTFMALKDIEVKYGDGKFRSYRADLVGAPSVQTTITLNFTETELVDRRRFKEGLYTEPRE